MVLLDDDDDERPSRDTGWMVRTAVDVGWTWARVSNYTAGSGDAPTDCGYSMVLAIIRRSVDTVSIIGMERQRVGRRRASLERARLDSFGYTRGPTST